ncbi:hypothetical protein MASR1M66_02010 [Aminivibrio sp.]
MIYLERLGRAEDGKYYNMRGEDVSATTPPLDKDGADTPAAGCVSPWGTEGTRSAWARRTVALLPIMPHLCEGDGDPAGGCLRLGRVCPDSPSPSLRGDGSALRGETLALLEALVNEGAVDGISRLGMKTVDSFQSTGGKLRPI